MGYCPSCGTEAAAGDRYCTACGEPLDSMDPEQSTTQSPGADGSDDGWNWLDPRGPFRSPRRALDVFNGVGLLVLLVGVGLAIAGVDAPFAILPDPLPIVLAIYVVVVLLVGLPIAGLLLITDNFLGYLRHG